MKAVLLIGGEATRLRPLTCNIPKAMVPVLNIPFLEHVIRHLSRHGVDDLILTQGQAAKSIDRYFGDGRRYGVRLRYVTEASPLGTAGAVKNAEKYLNDTFLVLNGDVFTDLDVSAMLDFHRQRQAAATIALTPVDDPTSYGVVESDARGRVQRFMEKPSRDKVTSNMINAGTYVLEPEVLALIPAQTKFSFERQLFPLLLERGQPVYAYRSNAYWIDTGVPERYLQLHRDLLDGKGGDRVLVGEGSYIHPSARLIGPVAIGGGCSILEGAVIERSVIWHNVRVGPGASIRDSVVANDCCLDAGSIIEESILGDHITVPASCRLKPGSKIGPGTTVAAGGA